MTRLITEWIKDIQDKAKEKENRLKDITGLNYAALAAKTSGWSAADLERASLQIRVGVVPVTSGEGIIGSFSEAVAAVTTAMGFQSFVTDRSDVSGLYEAYGKEADIVYMADDDRYVAINLNKRKIAENNMATAAGYLAALEETQGSLAGKEVLLLGFGAVGQEFLKRLQKRGIGVFGYDSDSIRLKEMDRNGVFLIDGPDDMKRFRIVIDATNQGGWIHQGMLYPEAWIASPGIPLSLDAAAYEEHESRLIHDYLEIGTAAMLGLAL
jgi:pyrrolysine biosynthesis protein PylD